MDIFSKAFWYSGFVFALMFLIAAGFALSTAEDGMLTVENMSGLEEQFSSFFHFIKWFIYPWLALGLFLFIRFLKGIFGK